MAGGNTAADNITLNLGTGGADVATEFISSVGHVQLIKLDVGDANTSTLVSSTDPLPVQVQGLGITTGRDYDFFPVAGSTDGSHKGHGSMSGREAGPVAMSVATEVQKAGGEFTLTHFQREGWFAEWGGPAPLWRKVQCINQNGAARRQLFAHRHVP